MAYLDKNSRNTSDDRTKVTSIIWGCATGMFVLCIPLASFIKDAGAAIAPAAIALGAGVGTVAVWQSSSRHSKGSLDTETDVRSLEERVANLEAIASSTELNIQHQFRQPEST